MDNIQSEIIFVNPSVDSKKAIIIVINFIMTNGMSCPLCGVSIGIVIIQHQVQLGNNLHKWVFQKVSKLHEPVGQIPI